MMHLVSIDSAAATRVDGELELSLTALDSEGQTVVLPYGYQPGDPHGLGPQLDAWFAANPDFPVEGYVPPVYGPADFPLTARQLRLGLVRHGVSLGTVEAAIDGIDDAQERDEAQIYWEFSTHVRWEHPMTQTLMALVGISAEDGAAMWMVAKDYEA